MKRSRTSTPDLPAINSRWHMRREDGRGLVEHNGNQGPQVFILAAVIPPKPGGQAWHVEYRRPSEKLSTRLNLVAFLNRFQPVPAK